MNARVQIRPGVQGFSAFCALIGEALEPFERRIARAHFGREREVVAVLPRGNLKTTLAAKLGLHHLLTVDGAAVTIGAASRDQARIAFERMRGFAYHPALDGLLVIRHLELRQVDGVGLLRVVASDGPRVHGLSSSLYIGDELWAWQGDELLDAMLTGLVKSPQARFLGISTAAAQLDSALGRLRARALAGRASRKGALIDAVAPGLHWLEWSIADDVELDDFKAIKAANPASYITLASLREQARRVSPIAFAQFHACRWGVGEGAWLPVGAWQARAGSLAPETEPVLLGVDIGGQRATSALVGVTRGLQVASVDIFEGDAAVLEISRRIIEIAETRPVLEVAYDPWTFRTEALRLERDHGLVAAEIPQSHGRMSQAAETLYAAIVGGQLVHPDHETLNLHVANAVAKSVGGRGWRLVAAARDRPIDSLIALTLAVERAQVPAAEPVRVLGWL